MMSMGGFLGFGIGVGVGLMKEVAWPALFLRACVAALLAGLLFRWWGRVWLSGLKDSHLQAAAARKRATPVGSTK